jgi:hypothetical protein
MFFIAWNGETFSPPFQPNELVECRTGDGLNTRDGYSVTWDEDGYRGENWIALTPEICELIRQILEKATK